MHALVAPRNDLHERSQGRAPTPPPNAGLRAAPAKTPHGRRSALTEERTYLPPTAPKLCSPEATFALPGGSFVPRHLSPPRLTKGRVVELNQLSISIDPGRRTRRRAGNLGPRASYRRARDEESRRCLFTCATARR